MFAEMTNEELSKIIKAFYTCGDCATCPCDMVLCLGGANPSKRHKEFALEVAERLTKN